MSPRTSAQYEGIRHEKRTLIMETALKLFAGEGYHNTSISKIAKAASISKGLLYNYFEGKEELLGAILKEATDKIWRFFDPNHDGILTRDEFYFFIRQNIKTIKENPAYWKLYSAIVLQPQVLASIQDDISEIGHTESHVLLQFFKNEGCSDPENELIFFSSLMKGATIQYVVSPESFPIDIIENKIISYYKEKLQS